jgi:predicted transcriptional regulator
MQTTKKTHVMYKVNLSHQQLKKYLSALTEAGLLEPVEGGYLTTQRGRLFVEKFRELSSVVETETGGASIVGTILVRNR